MEKEDVDNTTPVLVEAVVSEQEPSKEMAKPSPNNDREPTTGTRKGTLVLLGIPLAFLIAVVVVLGVTLGGKDDDSSSFDPVVVDPPILRADVQMKLFQVDTEINNRFATTKVVINFANSANCRAVHGYTLQLPITGRVTSLTMTSLDCIFESQVQTLDNAYDTFVRQAAQGKPAALLEAYDQANYNMQVSIPALGSTQVEMIYEELLVRSSHRIPFSMPFSPGQPVEKFHFGITITEQDSGVSNFELDDFQGKSSMTDGLLIEDDGRRATAAFDLQDLQESDAIAFPRILGGWYDSTDIPKNGLLLQSTECLMHLFSPTSSDYQPLPRNIVFLIDISGSMRGQKLADAKMAFTNIIDSLSPQDYFAVHTFSGQGTESVGGPALAIDEAKEGAIEFVNELNVIGSTNINDALLNGLARIDEMNDVYPESVPIIVMLTDGKATAGVTRSPVLAQNVRSSNKELGARIYGLAFGDDADLNLLKGIGIQNNGAAVKIFDGYGDSASQIEEFYRGQLGVLLMSDIAVSFQGAQGFGRSTKTEWPVLADGSEVVIRLVLPDNERELIEGDSSLVNTTTSAMTSSGPMEWTVSSTPTDQGGNECHQSYSHEKIAELLDFRDATYSLGESQMKEFYPFDDLPAFYYEGSLAKEAEKRATDMAIEARIVWPGLTALVTLESEECAEILDDLEVCTPGGTGSGVDDESPSAQGGDVGQGSTSSPGVSPPDTTTGFHPAAAPVPFCAILLLTVSLVFPVWCW